MLNDCVNVHHKNRQRYSEIFKLAAELAERDIPFKFECVAVGELKECFLLWYYDRERRPLGVAQGTGTNGFEDGLLEIDGLLYPEEAEKNEDGTLGWLTAGNVLERILKKEAEKNG